jgi:hypothetical protein
MTHGTLDAVKFIAAGENVALTTKGTKFFRASAALLHFSTLVAEHRFANLAISNRFQANAAYSPVFSQKLLHFSTNKFSHSLQNNEPQQSGMLTATHLSHMGSPHRAQTVTLRHSVQ